MVRFLLKKIKKNKNKCWLVLFGCFLLRTMQHLPGLGAATWWGQCTLFVHNNISHISLN